MGPGTPPIIESFWHILSFSFLASRTTTSVYYISRQPFRSSSVHLGLFCINVHDSYPFRRLLHSYTTTSHSQAIDPFPRIAVFLLITVSKHCFFFLRNLNFLIGGITVLVSGVALNLIYCGPQSRSAVDSRQFTIAVRSYPGISPTTASVI